MTTLLPILFFGFFLGMRHATDSDHVIAVTTIVSRQRTSGSAAWTGIFWGIGHSLTLLVIGGAIILFGIVVPERLGMSLEFCVALMLILLGALNLRATFRAVENVSVGDDHDSIHQHAHRHGDYVHSHPHGHEIATHGHAEDAVPPARLDRWFGSSRFYQALRPFRSARCMDWPAQRRSRCSFCPSFAIRSGRWHICLFLVSGSSPAWC